MITNNRQSRMLWGVILVGAGFLFLLSRLNIFGFLTALMWTALFSAGGLVFLYLFLTERQRRWWAAIPGCVLLGLGMVTGIHTIGPHFLEPLSGSLFLFSVAMGFALVYLAIPRYWWALIPAGVMTTLAIVAGIDPLHLGWLDGGALFLVGLGLTFLVVGLLPMQDGKEMRWALIPGGVLLAIGLLMGTPFLGYMGYLWPLALIVGGALLIWRQLAPRT